MTTARYVIRRAFQTYTPEEFHQHVTGMYKAPDVIPDSKAATGVRLSRNKNGSLIVTCKREEKTLTTAEVSALAEEYQMTTDDLTVALTKRKFTVKDQEGNVTNVKPRSSRRGRAGKTEAQRDAHLNQEPGHEQGTHQDKLFESGPHSDVHEKSSLQS